MVNSKKLIKKREDEKYLVIKSSGGGGRQEYVKLEDKNFCSTDFRKKKK